MRFLKRNDISLRYEVHGARTPVILAPGYVGSLEMWEGQVAPFSAAHRLVTYDPRGQGESSAPADMEAYSLARDYVADQLALMDHLGIQDAYVGGLSMGGMIAQEFVLQHPERVRGLLLFDTAPVCTTQMGAMHAAVVELVRSQGMSVIADALLAAGPNADDVIGSLLG